VAERVGFEPTDHIAAINALAGRPIRPLWHLSWEPRSVAPEPCVGNLRNGTVAEWTNAAALKAAEVCASGGSNPSRSAIWFAADRRGLLRGSDQDKRPCPAWQTPRCDGERIDLVFTTEDGGIVARQHVDKLIRARAESLDIDTAGLGTHVGRRTVVTAMSEDGVALDDIARHVGHRSATTTAGYVRSHKERDRATAKRAATLLDVPID
jgi:hypothetical protein